MIKKTLNYTNFNGEAVTEELHFNLTKAELAEMELSTVGGLSTKLTDAVAKNDPSEMIELFKELIKKSYGIKSEDGRRFVKTPEIQEEFLQTEAYSEVFIELLSDPKIMEAFMAGLIPQSINQK